MAGHMFRRPRTAVMAAALAGAVVSGVVAAQQPQAPPANAQPNFDAVSVRSFKVQGNVYMLAGAGGNVTVQAGDDGVLVVDTQFAQMADKLLAEIARITDNKPIRYVINTHVHPDHVGGNERFRRAGRAIVAGNVAMDVAGNNGAEIIAHENVQIRMSKAEGNTPAAPAGALPTDTFFGNEDEVFFNGEAIRLTHQPAAHTDGDVMVFFRKSDVIATGDIYVNTGYPVIDTARGGTIDGIIAGLNRILDITVPRDKQEGGTMVIPGHGRIADEADVVEYRDMVTIIRDRVQEMMKKGMTLQQIKAAGPTSDYDGRYGAASGFWTTDMFVEAVYRTLGGK
jgi:glyoxylase-like metal-dependent hydrolase (beta-lactamase superfamily II)